jgi:putative DNA primase/helicase
VPHQPWSGEDDWEDTLLPRLIACGADLTRIHRINAVVDDSGAKLPFDPARDIPALIRAASDILDIAMVIIDPVVSAVVGDGHKNAEVRRSLQPLSGMAEQLGIVVLGITHFTKNTSGKDPIERVTGSLAFGAAARLVMVTVVPKDQGEKRFLIRGKSNIGPSGGGYAYELVRKELPEYDIAEAQWISWGVKIDGTAREMLDEAEGVEQRVKRDQLGLAKAWLRDMLANGPVAQKDIQSQAREDGIGWRTVRRAKDALGVMALKDAGAGGAPWRWYPATKI